jgi:hypothetical protein
VRRRSPDPDDRRCEFFEPIRPAECALVTDINTTVRSDGGEAGRVELKLQRGLSIAHVRIRRSANNGRDGPGGRNSTNADRVREQDTTV